VKTAIKDRIRERFFDKAMTALTSLPPGQLPSRGLLGDLQKGWGNEEFASRIDYLEEIASRASKVEKPILECGAGLSTIILGWVAGTRGVRVITLEHIEAWYARISCTLRSYQIPGVDVCLTPLEDYGGFAWYKMPSGNIPAHFDLIICDGPPGTTKGNRYGLMPVFGHRINWGSTILLDDAEREGEMEVLKRWSSERPIHTTIKNTPSGTFAVVTIESDLGGN
jgi:hypothetical protein